MADSTALKKLQTIKARYDGVVDHPPGWDRQCLRDIMDIVIEDNFGPDALARLDINKHEAFLEALIRQYGGEP